MKGIFILISISFFLCACNKKIVGSWTKPLAIPAGYDTIMVAAFTINLRAKNIFEQNIAHELMQRGITASRSSNVFPPNFTDYHNDKEKVLQKIRNMRTKAVLTVSIINTASENNTFLTRHEFLSDSCHDKFWDYYTARYARLYKPLYYTTENTYYVETNLYDLETEELVWSATSRSYSPYKISDFAKGLAQFITVKLEKDHMIRFDREKHGEKLTARKRKQPVELTSSR